MLRALGVVLSIGLADSMNPSTIAPALYLATGESSARELMRFTAAVFATYFIGGGILVFGPGQALLALLPHPSATTRYILENLAGVVLLMGGAYVWGRRERLEQRKLPEPHPGGRSAALLGVTIMVVELPTAFPYFAAIAAVVGAGVDAQRVVFLLGVFNLCFVAPLLGVLATLTLAGSNAARMLARCRERLEARWPAVLATLALLAGVIVVFLGVTGLIASPHGLGRYARRLRKALHLHP